MKNYFKSCLGLVVLGILSLSACSNMEDKELKDRAYYKKHYDEAKNKTEWCLKKIQAPITDLNKLMKCNENQTKLSEDEKTQCRALFNYLEKLTPKEIDEKKFLNEFDKTNCLNAMRVVLR